MLTFELRRNPKGGGLAGIIKRIPQATQEGVVRAAQSTYAVVVSKAKGQLASCIRFEVVNMADRTVKAARVFNDTQQIPWSSYVEFGTGLYVEDQGNKEAIRLKRAKQIPWYIHVSMVPASFERYGYPLVTAENGEKYWEVDGMRARPYMHPAAFENRDRNVREVADAVMEMILEVCGG